MSHIFHRCFNVTVTFFNTRPDTVEKEPLNPEPPRTVGNLVRNLDCPQYVESNGYFFFGNIFFFGNKQRDKGIQDRATQKN